MNQRSSIRIRLQSLGHALRLRGPLADDPTARILHALLLALMLWHAFWAAVLFPFAARKVPVVIVLMVGSLAMALVWLRRGRFRQASLIFLAGTWLYTTSAVTLNGGIRSPFQVFYVALPISAVWLLGQGAALWTAAVSFSALLVFALLELLGVGIRTVVPGTPVAIWVLTVQATLIGAVPVAQILRTLRQTLAESHSAHEELRQYKDRLEVLVEDRTVELVEARDQALAANRAKTAFLANMSHELRTPLNAILGFSDLLRRHGASPEQRRDLDIIRRSGEHLLGLINDVLDVAKIEAGGAVLHVAPCELRGLVHGIVEMMRPRAEEKGLSLILVEPPRYPRFIHADAARLRQILINLLGNAVKFTDQGSVTLRLHARPGGKPEQVLLAFEVEDTGIGIAPEDQESIFAAFVQVGKPRDQRGTGLGLTITRQFVDLMQGEISVYSEPGKGSRFRVELPVERAPVFEGWASDDDWERILGLEPGHIEYRVLIAENDSSNSIVLARLLENVGFRVEAVDDGALAVQKVCQWRPHFLWMDLRMPVIDGFEAVRRIRALESGHEVKIAALTASAFESHRGEVLAAGFDDYLRKPYRPGEIFACLARHLGLRYRRAALPASPARPPQAELRPEDLVALPRDLLVELRQALIALNVKRISRTVERVAERNAPLGAALSSCAGRFAYTAMLDAVEVAEQCSAGAASTPSASGS